MKLADEIMSGMDEYTLVDIIYNKLLSTQDKILLEARSIDVSDILHGGVEDKDLVERLLDDWNVKLNKTVFQLNEEGKPEIAKPIEYQKLTLAFPSKEEQEIFEIYLSGYAAWRQEFNKQIAEWEERKTKVQDNVEVGELAKPSACKADDLTVM
jgi:hypothetical protein